MKLREPAGPPAGSGGTGSKRQAPWSHDAPACTGRTGFQVSRCPLFFDAARAAPLVLEFFQPRFFVFGRLAALVGDDTLGRRLADQGARAAARFLSGAESALFPWSHAKWLLAG